MTLIINWQEVVGYVPPNPVIEFTFQRVLCSRHGEPFRGAWPLGYATFALRAFERLLTNLDFQSETDGDPLRIAKALDGRPICCRLESRQLLALYRESSIAAMDRCQNCRQRREGSTYSVSNGRGGAKTFRHICFECVIHRLMNLQSS